MGRDTQRRVELGAGASAPERSTGYAPSDIDKLTRILERTVRAGIDPQRVIVALGIPAPIISVAKQRLGIASRRAWRFGRRSAR